MRRILSFIIVAMPSVLCAQTYTIKSQGSNNSAGGAYVAPIVTKNTTLKESRTTAVSSGNSSSTAVSSGSGGSGAGVSSGGSLFGGGAQRKMVRDYKESVNDQKKEAKKKFKSFSYIGPLIPIPKEPGILHAVSLNKKWGYIHVIEGYIINDAIPIIYDEVKYTANLLFGVRLGNKWGFVSKYGGIIIPIIYDDILNDLSTNTLAVVRDGKKYTIDLQGNTIGKKTDVKTGEVTSVNISPYEKLTDKRDNKIYETIKVENQVFMSQNLSARIFRNGDAIPLVTTVADWKNANEQHLPASCFYNNDPEIGKNYGMLYNWYAVSDPRGLAPQGWHIPNNSEFDILSDNIGGFVVVGSKLKSATNWSKGGGNNSSGFAGLPAGMMNSLIEKTFSGLGTFALWWTSNEINSSEAIYRTLDSDNNLFQSLHGYKQFGFSIRCIKE